MNPIEEILKDNEARHEGHIPDECCADFTWLETKLHTLEQKTRKEVIDEIAEWAKGEFTSDIDKIFLDDLLTHLSQP